MKALRIINILVLLLSTAVGLPRFALREGTSCHLCHYNPAGGSLRNDYSFNNTSFELSGNEKSVNGYTGMITEYLQIGGDFRLLNFITKETNQFTSAIFPMQMDIAGLWMLNDQLHLFVKQDVLRGSNQAWIKWTGLPGDSYLKAGKDIPAYGLKLDDHTSFIRGGNIRKKALPIEGLVFSPYLAAPGMVEAGLYKGDFYFSQSIANTFINGSGRDGFEESISDKAYITRMEYWPSFSYINGLFGASYLTQGAIRFGGIFGGISYGKLTWEGEVDVAEGYIADGVVLVSYSELAYSAFKNTDLILKFDFLDEDIDTTGSAIQRFTIGAEYFPRPFIELRFQSRFTKLIGYIETVEPEILFQIHTWF